MTLKVHGGSGEAIKCYVRVRGTRQRFVEFDFAVGSPDLAMEMIMPASAFEEFCQRYHAIVIGQQESQSLDEERAVWRYGTDDPDRPA